MATISFDTIKQILDYAIWAPSGDNSQPWRFEVSGNDIMVFNVPERDTSLYNYNMNASLVALGGLIENIKIASPHFGYSASPDFLPEGPKSNLASVVHLKPSEKIDDPLFPYIKERVTNRKPYQLRPISDEHKREFLKIKDAPDGVSIKLVDGRDNIEKIADAVSVNEKIVLEDKKLHEFLFHSITWSESEDKQKKGFFIKTLELKGPQIVAFKLFRSWRILQLFNKIGASNLVSRDNAKLYKQSGAFVAVVADDDSPLSFLKSGVLMQKFWLTATKVGINVQPVTGVLFLYHRINGDANHGLQLSHAEMIREAYSKLESIFDAVSKPITMMFRIGYGEKPSAKCLRRDPEIKFQT